jgi:hypothetical protein
VGEKKMNDILMQGNEYSWAVQLIAAVIVIIFFYMIFNQAVKLFSNIDEEMWEK